MSRRVLIGLALVCTLAGGAWVLHGLDREPVAQAQDAGAAGAPRAVAVEAAEVTADRVTTDISAVGSLQANESVTIAPEIAGRVAEILFREGEEVAAGDLLVLLDDGVLKAELAQARADLTLAEANFDRANTLADQGTGTERARDEAVAALRSAEASVELAQANLSDAAIIAPFEGRIGLRSVSVGDFVTAGERIVNLEQIDPIKVDFRIPEIYLTSVSAGQKISVVVDAVPGEIFEGEIYAIAPQVDINGRALQLRARIANPEGRLLPGLFARINVVVDVREDALLVPEAALVPQQGKRFVYRVVDGRAVLTEVSIGNRQDGMVEILNGLDAGALVVTAGQMKLSDGTPVEIIDRGAEA
ncbi:MAG TPA: efflux RND transporter periplasmic adaptor subunit [Alphaproteobacteria bacterium]|nr:efflux RND transporter periplasmic adaptor subunit [Alphaproteobacteria bacterium]